jgi:ribosomal protein L30/L7E
MSVIYVESWCRRNPSHDDTVETLRLARSIRSLERELRAAGFATASDLVATAGIALWQKVQAGPNLE